MGTHRDSKGQEERSSKKTEFDHISAPLGARLDNVVLEAPAPPGCYGELFLVGSNHRPTTVERKDPRTGEIRHWRGAPGPGYFVAVCDETRVVRLCLSIPRIYNMTNGEHSSNFPLHPFSSTELRNRQVKLTLLRICESLGMKVSAIGNDYLSALTIMGWVVRRAACSVDIEVDRGRDLIGSLSLTKRKGGVQAQTFSASGECAHAVQWEAAGIRTQVYLKGLQLQRGIRRFRTSDDEIGHGSREHLAEVAKAAKNVVRFEVTIQTMAAMRKAVGIETPWFPTLGLLVHPGVASQIVSRELVKLRLENVEEQRQSASPDLLGLWDRLQAARKKSDGITDTSLRAALTAYLLLGTGVDQKELVRRGVYKRQTLDKIVRLLTKLGLPPAAVESFDVIGLREQYISRLREWLGGIPSPIPNFEPDGILAYVRAAPWISGDDDVIFDDGEPYDLP